MSEVATKPLFQITKFNKIVSQNSINNIAEQEDGAVDGATVLVEAADAMSMEDYAKEHGKRGFTKSDMRQALGKRFNEKAWQRMLRHASRSYHAVGNQESPWYHHGKKLWFYS